MVRVIEVQFCPWDQGYYFDPEDKTYQLREYVIVRTDIGTELGVVIGVGQVKKEDLTHPLKPVLRLATSEDVEKAREQQKDKAETLGQCQELIKKRKLEMRLVDCAFSFDGGRVTFVFTAPSRVDFRDLLRDLNHVFQKSIRLQQIGVRDAAKYIGGIGICGRNLCCTTFLSALGGVSTELARLQEIDQRGTDRLLGACGRLRCCLRFEADMYDGYNETMISRMNNRESGTKVDFKSSNLKNNHD